MVNAKHNQFWGVALDSLHSHSSYLGGGHQPPPYHILCAYM